MPPSSENRSKPEPRPLRRRKVAAIGVVWVAAITFGMAQLARYDATPGTSARAATASPAGDALAAAGRPSVVAFFHPFCPCSRASMDALATLLSGRRDVAATAVFSKINDGAAGTADGDLWLRAAGVDGLRRVIDADGSIARRFDARTSGQVFVYAADGRLAFAGGLTASRGRSGESEGLRSARVALDGGTPTTRAANVFGCELE